MSAVDGTPGANDMPGRLVFSTTADGGNSPTEALRITSDKYLRMAASTGGIQFNGDTAAANALDDYEEGTCFASKTNWSPGSENSYVKIGNAVFCNLRGTVTTSTVTLDLPFATKYGDVKFPATNGSTWTYITGPASTGYTAFSVPVGSWQATFFYLSN